MEEKLCDGPKQQLMKVSLYKLHDAELVLTKGEETVGETTQLVLCFGSREKITEPSLFNLIKGKFPESTILICSTAGEIHDQQVLDDSVVVTAMHFSKTKVVARSVNVVDFANTYSASINLAKSLPTEDLAHTLVFSDGSIVNGSELVKGIASQIGNSCSITGGLAGDGARFQMSLVGLNGVPKKGEIVLLGLYGKSIHVTHGSFGGWLQFGLEKRVTNSSGNILMELEDQNALELYKRYLGENAAALPGSALLFPLSVQMPGMKHPLVRTILAISEEEKSMTFAGDVPVGSKVRFMRSGTNLLVEAAANAAAQTLSFGSRMPDFSLLISCVGRKLILGERVADEVKAVSEVFNYETPLAGFYSYGEIAPVLEEENCQLLNQTLTITSFFES